MPSSLPRRPWLGVELCAATTDRAEGPGLSVTRLLPGSTGARAGLRPGDRLLRIGGRELHTLGTEFRDIIKAEQDKKAGPKPAPTPGGADSTTPASDSTTPASGSTTPTDDKSKGELK